MIAPCEWRRGAIRKRRCDAAALVAAGSCCSGRRSAASHFPGAAQAVAGADGSAGVNSQRPGYGESACFAVAGSSGVAIRPASLVRRHGAHLWTKQTACLAPVLSEAVVTQPACAARRQVTRPYAGPTRKSSARPGERSGRRSTSRVRIRANGRAGAVCAAEPRRRGTGVSRPRRQKPARPAMLPLAPGPASRQYSAAPAIDTGRCGGSGLPCQD